MWFSSSVADLAVRGHGEGPDHHRYLRKRAISSDDQEPLGILLSDEADLHRTRGEIGEAWQQVLRPTLVRTR
jgi:hypothetical protein